MVNRCRSTSPSRTPRTGRTPGATLYRIAFSYFLVAIASAIAALSALAHPGSGLEVDTVGRIYVSDVFRETIWRVHPDGRIEPFVTDAWTHEFHLLPDDTLVFEREHDGDPAPQSLSRVTPSGHLEQLLPPAAERSQFSGTGFAFAPPDRIYFGLTQRGANDRWYAVVRTRELERENQGSAQPPVAEVFAGATQGDLHRDGPSPSATFRMIVDMRLASDGSLWVLDYDRVRRISASGQVSTQGPPLIEPDPENPPHRGGPVTTWNRLYGLAVDPSGHAYAAYMAGRRVVRVAPDGHTDVVHQSGEGWSPVGVACGTHARLFVSELSDRGSRLRVLEVLRDTRGARVVATLPPE